MNIPDLRKEDLDQETIKHLYELFSREGASMLDRLQELDKRITNTNFLTNGGGAVAVLTFLGAHPESSAVKAALVLFTLGVIATGIELRAMLWHFAAVSRDNHRRLAAFLDNQIGLTTFGKIPDSVGKASKLINHGAGVISQLLFISGVIAGAFGFIG